MKDLSLLVWLTQLGLSVAVPLAGFIFLALWLQDRFGWGQWALWVGIVLGLVCALDGLRYNLKTMKKMSERKDESADISFNEHD